MNDFNSQEKEMIKEVMLDCLKDEVLNNKSKVIIQSIINKLNQ